MGAYTKRDAALLKLGFGSYASYLDSDLWKSIRAKAFERDGKRCRCCGEPADLVHHDSYGSDVLRGRSIHRLFSLCNKCHTRVEFLPRGKKRTFKQVHEQLQLMLGLTKRPKSTRESRNQRRRKTGEFIQKQVRKAAALDKIQAKAAELIAAQPERRDVYRPALAPNYRVRGGKAIALRDARRIEFEAKIAEERNAKAKQELQRQLAENPEDLLPTFAERVRARIARRQTVGT